MTRRFRRCQGRSTRNPSGKAHPITQKTLNGSQTKTPRTGRQRLTGTRDRQRTPSPPAPALDCTPAQPTIRISTPTITSKNKNITTHVGGSTTSSESNYNESGTDQGRRAISRKMRDLRDEIEFSLKTEHYTQVISFLQFACTLRGSGKQVPINSKKPSWKFQPRASAGTRPYRETGRKLNRWRN